MRNSPVLTVFIVTTLALCAVAHRSLRPRQSGDPITIPLRKRTSLAGDNGVFDYEKALRSAEITMNKHLQNRVNAERNINTKTVQYSTRPAHPSEGRTGSGPLNSQGDTEWTGSISVGTAAQPFIVDFDTASADLWVPSSECSGESCQGKHTYSASASSTSTHQPGTVSIGYLDGSNLSGDIYTDTVSVGGIQVTNQYFASAKQMSNNFTGAPQDGILGMAFRSVSSLGQSPFFQTAVSQGAVSSPVFSFYLSPNDGSELYLGGTNQQHFKGTIESHIVVNASSPTLWQIDNAHVSVNGKTGVVSGFQTIIDSGTTCIYGPADAVAKVYSQVPGSQPWLSGLYVFPCSSIPAVSFSWGKTEWTISADNFNLGYQSEDVSTCIGALVAQNSSILGDNVWLLGDSFMKNVYTVFDVFEPSLGFAQLSGQ